MQQRVEKGTHKGIIDMLYKVKEVHALSILLLRDVFSKLNLLKKLMLISAASTYSYYNS